MEDIANRLQVYINEKRTELDSVQNFIEEYYRLRDILSSSTMHISNVEAVSTFEHIEAYKPVATITDKPKCNKCNANRLINKSTSNLQTNYVVCECANKSITYTPEKCEIDCIDNDIFEYKGKKINRKYLMSPHAYNATLFTGDLSISDVIDYVMFVNYDDCKRFCDSLNRG